MNSAGMNSRVITILTHRECGIQLETEQAEVYAKVSYGNPLFVRYLLDGMQLYGRDAAKLIPYAYRRMYGYYDVRFFLLCRKEEQRFLLMTSAAHSFDAGMARYILEDSSAGEVMSSLYTRDSSLFLPCAEETGRYTYHPLMQRFLKQKRVLLMSEEECRSNYRRIAEYERKVLQYRESYACYIRAADLNRANDLLEAIAGTDPAMITTTDLYRQYRETDDAYLRSRAAMACGRAALEAQYFNKQESLKYLQMLQENTSTEGQEYLTFLEHVLPYRRINESCSLPAKIQKEWISLPDCTVKEYMPTLIFGTCDLTPLLSAQEPLPRFLEQIYGKNTYELLKEIYACEKAYELEEDTSVQDLLKRLTAVSLQARALHQDLLYTISEGIQFRISTNEGHSQMAYDHVYHIRQAVPDSSGQRNAGVLSCIRALQRERGTEVMKWTAENLSEEQVPLLFKDRMTALNRIRVLIHLHRYAEAVSLIAKLKILFDDYHRTYEQIKIRLYEAILLFRTGKEWESVLTEAVQLSASSGLIRIIAEEGSAVLPLLKEQGNVKGADDKYLRKLFIETKRFRDIHPYYLKDLEEIEEKLTPREYEILRLEAMDLSTDAMCERLCLSKCGLKCQMQTLYKKLHAHSRTEAVSNARHIGVLIEE